MGMIRSLLCGSPLERRGGLLKRAVFSVFALAMAAHGLDAQSAVLSGAVVDSSGAAIAGAELAISGTGASVTSGGGGEFSIGGLKAGRAVIRARRLGFAPDSVAVSLSDRGATGVTIRLARVAAALSPVLVRANRADFTGRLAGYYQRLNRQNGGTFITRAQSDRENPRTLSQLLQHAPGMTVFRGRAGGQGVRMRGRGCWPLVWLDGSPMPSGDVDLDGIPPNTIHGIELYLGSTTAPSRYSAARDLSSCGTILLWSRGPDTDPLPARRWSQNLEQLVASMTIFTADQVDSAAKLDPKRRFEVAYPPALLVEKVAGSVIAEFVVSVDGRVEQGTFGVVASSDRLFIDAVKQAVEGAVYKPAMKDGRLVRQVVHQPFIFAPPR